MIPNQQDFFATLALVERQQGTYAPVIIKSTNLKLPCRLRKRKAVYDKCISAATTKQQNMGLLV